MDRFNDLLDLPRSAVYAIVDETHKRVLVQYSTSLLASLSRLVDKIFLKENPCRNLSPDSDLKFVVLEESDCRNRLMVRTGFYMREYKALGYELLVEQYPVQYSLKCVTQSHGMNYPVVIQAVLVSKRNSKILVGEFNTLAEYDEFKRLNYSIDPVIDIVYHESVSSRIEKT